MRLGDQIREDLRTALERDPSQRGAFEALTTSSGLLAVVGHRIAHRMWRRDAFLLARWTSTVCRWFTGADLHPAAQLGRRVVIEHGAGVIIGQTAEVGDDARIAQGVSLGGVGEERSKRHPTLASGVVVGPGAVLMGSICIGTGARIVANSVVLEDVPAQRTAQGIPARLAAKTDDGEDRPGDERCEALAAEVASLRRELGELRARLAGAGEGASGGASP